RALFIPNTAPTVPYPLSLHDALPILPDRRKRAVVELRARLPGGDRQRHKSASERDAERPAPAQAAEREAPGRDPGHGHPPTAHRPAALRRARLAEPAPARRAGPPRSAHRGLHHALRARLLEPVVPALN